MQKKNRKKVAIVLTVYNYKYTKQFESVLYSITKQKIDKDIIICEQSEEISIIIRKLCDKYGIKYVNILPEKRDNNIYYNIGRVRNIAALCSDSEYIYFTDADILLTDENYIAELVEYSEKNYNVPCMRPKMRRLKEISHEAFSQDYLEDKEINYDEKSPYCYSEYNQRKKKIEPLKAGERYKTMYNLVHVGEHVSSQSNIEFEAEKMEEFSETWKTVVHFGGNLCRRKDFIMIGGYSEKYYNWGAEDIDFQWKMGESCGMQMIDYVLNEYSLIHYEHASRCNNALYAMNRNVFTKRREHNVEEIIKSDLEEKNSFIARWNAGDFRFCKDMLVRGKEYLATER